MNFNKTKSIVYFILYACIFTHFQVSIAQPYLLKTIPSGASVLDNNEKVLGKTPLELEKILEQTREIVIQMEGYFPVEISFPEKIKKTSEFPSCINSCNECRIQYENFPELNNKNYSGILLLRKKNSDKEQSLFVSIDTPKIELSNESVLGKINGSLKKLNSKDIHSYIGYPGNMDMQMLSAFNGTYIDPRFISDDNEEKTLLYKPKIILKPIVKEMNFDFTGSLFRDLSGPCEITCDWQISTISDKSKVIASIPVKSAMYRGKNDYDIVLYKMLALSGRDLLEIDTLHSFLLRLQKEYLDGISSEQITIAGSSAKLPTSQKEILKLAVSSVVTVETDKGFGSGVFISGDGYIITNHHVTEGNGNVYISSGIHKKVKAQIVKAVSDYDVTLLKIPGTGYQSLPFGNTEESENGEDVYAIGTPLDKSLQQSITKGIISGIREWNGVKFIQTDVRINQGNSGGPLINASGEIIGITTLKASGKNVDGIGFCIPSNSIVEKLNLKFETP